MCVWDYIIEAKRISESYFIDEDGEEAVEHSFVRKDGL